MLCVFWTLASSHTYDSQIFFSYWVSGLLSFDGFFWRVEDFSLMLFHLFIFAFVAFASGVRSEDSLPKPMLRDLAPVSSWGFMDSGLMFKSIKNFVCAVRKWPSSILVHWVPSLPVSAHWRDSPSLMAYLLLLCRKLGSSTCGLVSELSVLVHWPDVCVYASTILFWWPQLCNLAWNPGVCWLHLSFSRLLWVFGVFWDSIQVLGLSSSSSNNATGIQIGISTHLSTALGTVDMFT